MKRRGLTLLESFVCNLLVACVILTVFGLFVGSSRALQQASQRAQAGDIAQRELEARRAIGFEQLLPGRQAIPAQTLEGITYEGQWEVRASPDHPTLLKIVRVEVRWTFQNRPQQLVRESWLSALRN